MHFKILSLVLFFGSCSPAAKIYVYPSSNTTITAELENDKAIDNLVQPYKEELNKTMKEIIGFSPAFVRKKKPSSALGNFMADATLEAAKLLNPEVSICLLNYGGIRSTLDSGDITLGDVYQLMPFENELVLLKFPLHFIDTLRSFVASKGGEPLAIEWTSVPNVITTEKGATPYFILVTNDYMANGGDNYALLMQATQRQDTGIKIRDALIAHIKNNTILTYDYTTREL